MSQILKSIDINLFEKSTLKKALKQVEDFERELSEALNRLCEKLLEMGVEIAKIEVVALGAIDTGSLQASIGHGAFDPVSGTGVIYAGAYHAIYVEYGTGVVGAAYAHPGLGEKGSDTPVVIGKNGNVYTGYDSQGHGEKGWVYQNDKGQYRWSKGYWSRPFMYNTMMELRDYVEQEGCKVIATYIPGGG